MSNFETLFLFQLKCSKVYTTFRNQPLEINLWKRLNQIHCDFAPLFKKVEETRFFTIDFAPLF